MREQEIAAAVLAGPDAIVGAGVDGTITFWNPGAERVFGFTGAEAVGANLDLIIPERLRPRHWRAWQEFLDTGRSRYGAADLLRVPSHRKDGTPLSIEFTLHLVTRPDGTVAGIAATIRDATERFAELRDLRRQLAGRSDTA